MPTITFKMNADQARRIRAMARKQHRTLSDFIRHKTLVGDKTPNRVRQVHCRDTGATIFASASGAPPLTTEAVREMLADFP
jgi:tartrate dehydratase alpha subunit/fumarate hydratase class I-like protein